MKRKYENRKRCHLFSLCFLMFFLMLLCGKTTVRAESNGTFEYDVDYYSNTCTITEYIGNSSKVVFPSYIDGCKVTGISGNVFKEGFWGVKKITSVTLPGTIKEVGPIFANTDITSLVLPKNVTKLGDYLCSGCKYLRSVKIQGKVTEIPQYAFKDCGRLTTINIPSTVKVINREAFKGCKSLKTIKLHSRITFKGGSQFADCTSLKSFVMPKYASASGGMFGGCSSLEKITLSSGQKTLYMDMFKGCTALKEIIIPKTVEYIVTGCFGNCPNLSSVKIQNVGVTIERKAFEKSSKLTIYGVKGSTAQSYCKQNQIRFKAVAAPKKNGWYKNSSGKFYFKNNAVLKGRRKISGDWYYFEPKNGKLCTGWSADKKYYCNSKGVIQTGWKKINNKKYYFKSNGIKLTGGIYTIKGKKYCFYNDGHIETRRGWYYKATEKKPYFFVESSGVITKFSASRPY